MKRFSTLVLFFIVTTPIVHATEASLPVLLERAKTFEQLGLPALAWEEYGLIRRLYPSAPGVAKSLEILSRHEAARHADNARRARTAGVLPLALVELDRAIACDPSDAQLKALQSDWGKEERLRSGLRERVSKDYLEGLSLYQKGENDRALECFMNVLNLDPNHKGALAYVERIGQKIDVGTKE